MTVPAAMRLAGDATGGTPRPGWDTLPVMAERVLSTRELNRALLARQLLLERSRLPLAGALERVGGLQSQYAPSAYVALWSRLANFRRQALTTALEERRAVQATLMRATIHVVSAGDYPLFAAGIRRSRREWWRRVQRHQVEGLDMGAVASRLKAYLAEGPRRQAEIMKHLEDDGFPRMAWSGAGLWVDLVRVPPSGTWERRRADLYALAEDWLGSSNVTEVEGQEHLVRRYLGGFGPARLSDVANWAGLPVTTIQRVVEVMRIRRFRDEEGGELIDLPRAPLPAPDTPAPVRFLPTWDATLLAHARRTQILPETYRPRVFHTKTPHSVPTFLVDGAVAGTWRHEGGRVRLEPFEPITRAVRREVDAEAARLAAFHSDEPRIEHARANA
jgi:Winged helix DNA-binding domain